MLTVNIETDNAAFEGDNRGPELARILRKLAKYLDEAGSRDVELIKLRDANGNAVGKAVLE